MYSQNGLLPPTLLKINRFVAKLMIYGNLSPPPAVAGTNYQLLHEFCDKSIDFNILIMQPSQQINPPNFNLINIMRPSYSLIKNVNKY
jgi:hypothetical protein